MELMYLLFFSEILMTDAQLKCICGTWYTFTTVRALCYIQVY